MGWKFGAASLVIVMLVLCSSCTLVKGTLQLPDLAIQTLLPFTKRAPPPDPVEIQSKLIRFSDHYLEAVTRNMRKFKRDGKYIEPRELTRRRIQYTNEVLAITTGSNAFANLLDMIVLVTLTRMRVEDYQVRYPNEVDVGPMVKIFEGSESEIWRISSTALTPEQQTELRSSLGAWLQRNPTLGMAPDLADLDFVAKIREFAQSRRSSAQTSVFNLLMIDPLAGLDPAAKELAETRLMAERALFLTRHLPELIRWETEYLTMNTLEFPPVAKLLADASKLSESADRFSQITQNLPNVISSEREKLVATLKSERQGFTALASESKDALTAGHRMADSANATLKSFQAILTQLGARPSTPNAEPFRIGDYAAAAAEIGQTSLRLAELLSLFNQTVAPNNIEALSNRVDLLSRQVEARSQHVVDYAVRRILIAAASIFAMALVYHLLRSVLIRLAQGNKGGTSAAS